MASIQTRKRKDGTTAWRVVFRITPGGAPTTETFDTAHDAENFARLVDRIGGKAAREKRDAATWDQALTFTEAFAHMRENALDLTPGTLYDYERTLDRCGATARFGALSLDMIDHSDIQAWANERAKTVSKQTGKPLSPKTLRNELSIVSSVFSHAVREGWIESSPTAHTRLPKARRPSIRVLTFEEYAAILAEVREDQRPLVQFLATTGARWGEVTALEWGDLAQVSDEAWRVTIQRAWKRSERSGRTIGHAKTATSHRTITIPASAVTALGKRGKPRELIFQSARGGRIQHDWFHQRIWRPAIYRAGVTPPPKVHDLRHWHASVLLAEGVPMHVVSKRLGHSSITTTVDTYSFLTPEMHVAGMQSMQRIATALPSPLEPATIAAVIAP